ncbi:MAG: hypothetical protein ACYDAY_06310 [Candidatus Dormibacteria bacterium]
MAGPTRGSTLAIQCLTLVAAPPESERISLYWPNPGPRREPGTPSLEFEREVPPLTVRLRGLLRLTRFYAALVALVAVVVGGVLVYQGMTLEGITVAAAGLAPYLIFAVEWAILRLRDRSPALEPAPAAAAADSSPGPVVLETVAEPERAEEPIPGMPETSGSPVIVVQDLPAAGRPATAPRPRVRPSPPAPAPEPDGATEPEAPAQIAASTPRSRPSPAAGMMAGGSPSQDLAFAQSQVEAAELEALLHAMPADPVALDDLASRTRTQVTRLEVSTRLLARELSAIAGDATVPDEPAPDPAEAAWNDYNPADLEQLRRAMVAGSLIVRRLENYKRMLEGRYEQRDQGPVRARSSLGDRLRRRH